MFTNIDFRGVARGPCSNSNCECDSYARSESCDVSTSPNATLQCGWCCYCGHPPVSHSRIDDIEHMHLEPACLALEAARPLPPLQLSLDGTGITTEQSLLEDMQVVEVENIKTELGVPPKESLQVQEASERRGQPTFAAVRFLKDKSVAVVPLQWIEGSKCMWPHLLSPSDIAEAAQRAETPDSSFIRRGIQVLRLTSSYNRARTWLAEQGGDKLEALTDEVVCRIKFPRLSSSAARGEESRLKDWPHKQSSPGKAACGASLSDVRKNACSPQPRVWIHRLSSSNGCTQPTDSVVERNKATESCREVDIQNRCSLPLSTVCKSKIVACSEGERDQTPEGDVTDTSGTLSNDVSPRPQENGDRVSRKSTWHFKATERAELEEAGEALNGSSIEGQDPVGIVLKELRTIRQQNERILAALGIGNQSDSVELAKVQLPVTDLDSLDELESKLALDPVFRACLVHRLSLVGGRSLRMFTAGVLRSLFTDAVGQHFSVLGQRHKRRLKDMVLYDVFEQAIRSNDSYKSTTSYSIRKAAAAWLKNCPSRIMAAKRKLGEDANDSSSGD
uniref:Protein containing DUF4806 domain n=1 Tax=Rhipicephalus zambeziensis TaxID=60191 RepID=A0A224YQB9_9ACAR